MRDDMLRRLLLATPRWLLAMPMYGDCPGGPIAAMIPRHGIREWRHYMLLGRWLDEHGRPPPRVVGWQLENYRRQLLERLG